jgi:hypothetical protein
MSDDLLKPGGKYNNRKTGSEEYEMTIPLTPDEHGRIARECPSDGCSPAYFKIKPGTGITEDYDVAYCPYCRHEANPQEFFTKEQSRYAEEIAMREVHKGVDNMIRNAFGLDPSGKKKMGGDFISIEMSYKPGRLPHVRSPFEEELLRATICPHCGLDHAVFGLAFWCPDCGKDIFMTHVNAEYNVVRTMLSDVDRRRNDLDPRIAARDIENCLEDTVSIFEAVLKAVLVRYLHVQGKTEEEVHSIITKKVRTNFQNIDRAIKTVKDQMQLILFEDNAPEEVEKLSATFEKRHPITHNLGVVDRKYLEKALAAEKEGREISVQQQEILEAIDISIKALSDLHEKIFPSHNEEVS